MIIIKDLGTKQVGNRLQRFALIQCPQCKEVEERRIRTDCSDLCRTCAMKNAGKKRSAKGDAQGDTVKTSEHFRLYQIWRGMKRRCTEPNAMGYNLYGAKGVTVCDEWLHSYSAFKEWSLSNGYTPTMTIDKDELCEKLNISPKIYSPQTCIWKSREENSTTNLKLTEEQAKLCAELLESKQATPQELADTYNVKYKTILSRTSKYRTKKYIA